MRDNVTTNRNDIMKKKNLILSVFGESGIPLYSPRWNFLSKSTILSRPDAFNLGVVVLKVDQ